MQKMKQMSIVLFKHTLSAIPSSEFWPVFSKQQGMTRFSSQATTWRPVYSRNCETETW